MISYLKSEYGLISIIFFKHEIPNMNHVTNSGTINYIPHNYINVYVKCFNSA